MEDFKLLRIDIPVPNSVLDGQASVEEIKDQVMPKVEEIVLKQLQEYCSPQARAYRLIMSGVRN